MTFGKKCQFQRTIRGLALYDLNDPIDARSYIQTWVRKGVIELAVSSPWDLSDACALSLARSLFMSTEIPEPLVKH